MAQNVTLLVQASLIFVHPTTGEKSQVKADARPQTAPNWVLETPTYKAAFKSGLVYAINYVAVPPPQEAKKVPALPPGFNDISKPTIDSLVKEGVGLEAAQHAIAEMNKASQPLPDIDAPIGVKEMLDTPVKPSNFKMVGVAA